ncbi:hypothetical protein FKM82_001809 [Ascaphus truei]
MLPACSISIAQVYSLAMGRYIFLNNTFLDYKNTTCLPWSKYADINQFVCPNTVTLPTQTSSFLCYKKYIGGNMTYYRSKTSAGLCPHSHFQRLKRQIQYLLTDVFHSM